MFFVVRPSVSHVCIYIKISLSWNVLLCVQSYKKFKLDLIS